MYEHRNHLKQCASVASSVAIYGLTFQIETQPSDGYEKTYRSQLIARTGLKEEELVHPMHIGIEHHAETFFYFMKAVKRGNFY